MTNQFDLTDYVSKQFEAVIRNAIVGVPYEHSLDELDDEEPAEELAEEPEVTQEPAEEPAEKPAEEPAEEPDEVVSSDNDLENRVKKLEERFEKLFLLINSDDKHAPNYLYELRKHII